MGRRSWIAVSLAVWLALVAWSSPARAGTVLRMGTVAPETSPWGQVFKIWARSVDQSSGGRLQVNWQWGGSAGDERAMVAAIKSGTLDGAFLSGDGLGALAPDLLVFQAPGAFASWAKLDAARSAVEGATASKLLAAGASLLGWADIGEAKIMSSGVQVRGPATLASGTTLWPRSDLIGDAFLSAMGNPRSVRLPVPEIFPALSKVVAPIVDATPLMAEQEQWTSKTTYVNTMTTFFAVGTLVVSSAAQSQLPEDLRSTLLATSRQAASDLNARIRALDSAAFANLKNTKVTYDPTAAELADWSNRFAQCRAKLRGHVIDAAFFDAVMKAAH